MPRDTDWLASLPRILRQRFDGLGSYVGAVLEEERLREKLSQTDVAHIHLALFVRSLHEFLSDGSEAAEKAVDAFSALGVKSFRIGSEEFEGRNDAVTRGSRLAAALLQTAGAALGPSGLDQRRSFREEVVRLAKELSRAGRLGKR